jgi:hypothetical protein
MAPDGTLSSGALQPNSITCAAGSNNFTAINGQVTACSVTSYLTPNSINSACTKPTFTGGQATSCGSATYSDVGADAAGAAAARAAPGTCSGGQFVSATTTSGVTCATPAGSGNVSTTGLTINRLAKAGSSTALTDSHVTDDGTTVTVGGFSSDVLKWSNGTISALLGELSDVGGWVGLAFNSNSLAVAQVALYANLTTGTVVNAPSGKTVYFDIANTNYASVSSAGIAASNITSTPGASKIPIADGSGKLDGWVTANVSGSSGCNGCLTYWTGASTLASTGFGITATPTPNVAVKSDGSSTVNAWVTHASGDQKVVKTYSIVSGNKSATSAGGSSPSFDWEQMGNIVYPVAGSSGAVGIISASASGMGNSPGYGICAIQVQCDTVTVATSYALTNVAAGAWWNVTSTSFWPMYAGSHSCELFLGALALSGGGTSFSCIVNGSSGTGSPYANGSAVVTVYDE